MVSMTAVVVTIGADNVSNNVQRLQTKQEASAAAGIFTIDVRNSAGTYTGSFGANEAVSISLGGAVVFTGNVDAAHPIVSDSPGVYTQSIRVTGRGKGRELVDYTVNKYYPTDNGDDIIDDLLSTSGSNITYTSPTSATTLSYDSKDEYLLNSFRKIVEVTDQDFYVDTAGALQLFPVAGGTRPSSTIALTDGLGSASNLISFERDEVEATDVKNYIIVRGKQVVDGWTELNASDYSKATSGTMADETTNVAVGAGAIKFTKGAASASWMALDFSTATQGAGGLYGRTYLDWSGFSGGEMKFKFMANTMIGFINFEVKLTDTLGNEIGNKDDGIPSMVNWYTKSYTVGADTRIAGSASKVNRQWRYLSTASDISFAGAYTSCNIDAVDANGRAVLTADGGTPYSGLLPGDYIEIKNSENPLRNNGKYVVYSATNTVLTLTAGLGNAIIAGVDNAADTSIDIGRLFNWRVEKIKFEAPGAIFSFFIDGLEIPSMMYNVSQDATSQSNYGTRHLPIRKTDLESQLEIDAFGSYTLLTRKDPLTTFNAIARGTAGISGATNNWKPGYTVTVTSSGESLSSVSYRMMSITHNFDTERTVNGFDFWTELALVPGATKLSLKRYEMLNEEVALLRELRENISRIEQEEEGLDIGYPALPAPVGDLYLMSPLDWINFWEADQYPISISTATDSVASGTNTVSDAAATEAIAIKRLSSASSGRMFGSVVRPGIGSGAPYAHFRLKVANNASTATVLQLQVYNDDATSNLVTQNISPDLFTSSAVYQVFSVRFECPITHSVRFRGQFTTGVTDVWLDWIGTSHNPTPYGTSGLAVDSGSDNDNPHTSSDNDDPHTSSDNDDPHTSSDADDPQTNSDVDTAGGAGGHTHGTSTTAGRLPTAITTLYAASSPGGSPTSSFIAATSVSNESYMTALSGVGTHSHGMSNPGHDHGITSPNHDHGITSPNHDHGITSPSHDHGITSPEHDHNTTEGVGHVH